MNFYSEWTTKWTDINENPLIVMIYFSLQKVNSMFHISNFCSLKLYHRYSTIIVSKYWSVYIWKIEEVLRLLTTRWFVFYAARLMNKHIPVPLFMEWKIETFFGRVWKYLLLITNFKNRIRNIQAVRIRQSVYILTNIM